MEDNINDTNSLKRQMKEKLCLVCRFKSNKSNFFNWCDKCKLKHFKLNYGKFPSGNNEIDNLLKNNYCKSKLSRELMEWIPYSRFMDVRNVTKFYSALLNNYICDWNKDKLNWSRKIKDKVVLKDFENWDDLLREYSKQNITTNIYGISKDPISLNYILVFDFILLLCIKCRFKLHFFDWCSKCRLNHFKLNYGEFPSGNNEIDNLLKDNYCKSKSPGELIEWIPYNKFKDITYVVTELYSAKYIRYWDENKLNEVMLKNFENLDDLLHEYSKLTGVCGISKDPNSLNYILVFDFRYINYSCIKCRVKFDFFRWCDECKLKHFKLNFGEFPSGNNEIDNLLKDDYCKSKSLEELIEWIPYSKFKDITYVVTKLYSAFLSGYICYWNKNKLNWGRRIEYEDKVLLKNFENLDDLLEHSRRFKYYGISKDPTTNYYICVDSDLRKFLCFDCFKSSSFFNWCGKCKILHFSFNYSNFIPSDNDELGLILKNNYCESKKVNEFIEWIPYTSFVDITFINKGGFSKVYSALWLNNNIYEWDNPKSEWKRFNGYKNVALKVLENSYNISGFLQELQSYYKIGFSHKITKLYGISKDPKTQNYILVLEYVYYGSLRNFLDKYNKFLLTSYKIQMLKNIAEGLNYIHSKNLVHQDIHSGNILNTDFDRVKITDLGLSKFVNQPSDNNEKEKSVYGNLPYIAPEVLQGKPYTTKADIYAFGIIINEVFTGERPFINYDDGMILTIDICRNGLRPRIHENTPECLINLLNKCWDGNPFNRPTADEIIQSLTYFGTDNTVFENLRDFNNKILLNMKKQSKNTIHSSKLLQLVNFAGLSIKSEALDCCISISNQIEESVHTSTSRNNYPINSSNLSTENQVLIQDDSQCYDCLISYF